MRLKYSFKAKILGVILGEIVTQFFNIKGSL